MTFANNCPGVERPRHAPPRPDVGPARLTGVTTPLREVPEPPQADAVVPVTVGTLLWGLAFLVLLPFRDRLAESGDDWWLWVALVGFLLGVLGTWWVRRRRAIYERAGKSAAGQS